MSISPVETKSFTALHPSDESSMFSVLYEQFTDNPYMEKLKTQFFYSVGPGCEELLQDPKNQFALVLGEIIYNCIKKEGTDFQVYLTMDFNQETMTYQIRLWDTVTESPNKADVLNQRKEMSLDEILDESENGGLGIYVTSIFFKSLDGNLKYIQTDDDYIMLHVSWSKVKYLEMNSSNKIA